MLELADLDQQAGREGTRGIEGEEEIKAIMGRVYKIRPFGVKVSGIRDLNPSGICSFLLAFLLDLLTSSLHALVQILIY
jgi:hypothetical protein